MGFEYITGPNLILTPTSLGSAMTATSNVLSANVALNSTSVFFDGPSVAQGTVGTWFVSGSVVVQDTSGPSAILAKLWDGATVLASGIQYISAAGAYGTVHLCGYISGPVGNLRISCRNLTFSTAAIQTSFVSSDGKNSTITAVRIG